MWYTIPTGSDCCRFCRKHSALSWSNLEATPQTQHPQRVAELGIDLFKIRTVMVDPGSKIVAAQVGATWRDVDRATVPYVLADVLI